MMYIGGGSAPLWVFAPLGWPGLNSHLRQKMEQDFGGGLGGQAVTQNPQPEVVISYL